MGNSDSKKKPAGHFNISEWVELGVENSSDSQNEHGNFTTFQHKVTHEQIDRYQLAFSSEEEVDIYHQCFLQRLREEHIVNTIQFKTHVMKEFCSTNYLGEVYIQHIPVRLSDITDIPFPQNIYILKCALIGFSQLYKNIGYFEVKDDHICIDKYGIVRVWMNSDLSKNYPDEEILEANHQSESTMVNRILQIVQANTDNHQQPIPIEEYFHAKNKRFPLFEETLELLDEYVEEYRLTIPEFCQSILQIFEENPDSKPNASISVVNENSQEGVTYLNSQRNYQSKRQTQDFRFPNTKTFQPAPIYQPNFQKIPPPPQPSVQFMSEPKSQQYIPPPSKPIVRFNYKSKQIETVKKVPQKPPSSEGLSDEKKRIVENVLTSLNIELPKQRDAWSYNVTGDTTEELDPEIASDLLKYL